MEKVDIWKKCCIAYIYYSIYTVYNNIYVWDRENYIAEASK